MTSFNMENDMEVLKKMNEDEKVVYLKALTRLAKSDGDFDAGIDPVYGHHRGNKYEDGYIDGSSWDDDDT